VGAHIRKTKTQTIRARLAPLPATEKPATEASGAGGPRQTRSIGLRYHQRMAGNLRTYRGIRKMAGRAPGAVKNMLPAAAHPDVTGRPKRSEVVLAFKGFVEQVRLGLRDGRKLIHRLVAGCETSAGSSKAHVTSRSTSLVSVPLVVFRPTTDREQIEIHDLVQRLGADGYQVTPRGP
jgi:hypothetical protein